LHGVEDTEDSSALKSRARELANEEEFVREYVAGIGAFTMSKGNRATERRTAGRR
jgi:hypothetical protein